MRGRSLGILGILGIAAGGWLVAVVLGATRPRNVEPLDATSYVWGLSFLAFPIVGAVLAWKRPSNLIGWVFLICPALIGVSVVMSEVANHQQHDTSPWFIYAADALFFVTISSMGTLFLVLFPTGKLPSRRWRWVVGIGVIGIATTFVWAWTRSCSTWVLSFPTPETNVPGCSDPVEAWFINVPNPLGLSSPGGEALWAAIGAVGASLVMIALLAGVSSLFFRYRASGHKERQQLRWLILLLSLLIPLFLAIVIADTIFLAELAVVSNIVQILTMVGIPTTIAIAILRHQLLDIDRVINRAVAYTILVALLAIVFAAGALWIPTALTGSSSNVAVAATTLAVAALFNPLRLRVQRAVNRRFNRTPYDHEVVADDLSTRLRDNTSPESILNDWVTASADALSPRSAGAWTPDRT